MTAEQCRWLESPADLSLVFFSAADIKACKDAEVHLTFYRQSDIMSGRNTYAARAKRVGIRKVPLPICVSVNAARGQIEQARSSRRLDREV